MKNTKRSLMSSVVALLLCFAMLLSTTYAWFTDSAISESNIIQSGNLDVEMYWSETLLATDSNEWKNADGVPIFTYDNWEPGYTDVKYVKVKNAGNLSLQWRLNIEAEGEVTELADVIDVYYINPVSETVTTLSDKTSVGVLSNVIDAHTYTSGVLLPAGEVSTEYAVGETILAIAFHMQEDAGNAYQGKSIGDGFSVSLIATQFSYESDSFDKDYDKDAQWPNNVIVGGNSATATVVPDANNKVSSAVSLLSNDGAINAEVPAGVKLDNGVNKLTLSVKDVADSKANVTLSQTEATMSIDVHIDGVAADNDVVMAVGIKELLPVGLNMGNYRFYHVENGATVEMMLLDDGATPVHNNYEYDPATGGVVLYLKSFSEVALVADNVNPWEGKFDYTWYDASKTELTIANADQLAAFGAIVGGMAEGIERDSFDGKTVKLLSDINLGDKESENKEDIIFYPIGYWNNEGTYNRKPLEERTTAVESGLYSFCGIFDGNGHTIANFYHNTWEMKGDHNWYDPIKEQYYRDGMGLFGKVYGGTVKNLTVKNFSSDGEIATTGVIAAYADGATFENIAIFNCNPRVYNIGNGGIVGCVGWYANEANLKTTFKNITVDNSNKISALWGSYDVACGGIVGQYYPTSGQSSAGTPVNSGISFENCHISAQMDVYNDVCGNYQYYAYRYAGMLIGSVRENVTIDGHSYPKMDGITAKDCTVHFGTWNEYYYCEFEANGHPSYSGPDDYKFSRVPHSEINFTDSNGNGIIDTEGERASVTGCKHEHTAAENNKAIFLPFNNLVTGYGWGVTTKVVGELDGVTILDRTEGNSVEKFEGKVNELVNNTTIKLGDIFNFVDNGVKLVPGALTVTVTNVDEKNPVSATIGYDRTNWENTTITFSGVGAVKITIQDYYFCTPTTIDVNITERQPVVKFETKFTGDFLYRVGNANNITLGTILGAKSDASIGNVSVEFETISGTATASSFTANASDWTKGTIQFSGTGIVKVTITDDDYCIPTELELEVVNAVNATSATSAKSNNVVLLNDVGLHTLEVSGGYTLYGNGFKMTATNDVMYDAMGVGFVTLKNGTLDNVQIVCPNFSYAIVYTNQIKNAENTAVPSDSSNDARGNVRSAVIVDGNSKIVNSYIHGGRAAIFHRSGNLLVDGSTISGGAAANIHTVSATSLTLRNATLIQKPFQATVHDTSKTIMGFSVLLECGDDGNATPVILEGTLVQDAWINEEYKQYVPSAGTSLVSTALGKTEYLHDIDGDGTNESLSIGFTYIPQNSGGSTIANVTDNRINKSTVPYAAVDVGNALASAKVYSYKNANGTSDGFKNVGDYVPTAQGVTAPTVSFNDTNADRVFETSFDSTSDNRWESTLTINLDNGNYTFSWDKFLVQKHGSNLNYTVATKDGTAVNTSSAITLTASGVTEYVVTVTDGDASHTVCFILTATKTSIPEPVKIAEPNGTHYLVVKNKNSDWSCAINALDGAKIEYYDGNGQKQILDLSSLVTTSDIGQLNGTSNIWTKTKDGYTLKITCGYIHDTKQVYGMPVAVEGKLYFTISNTNGYVSTSTSARSVTLTYEFTDPNGKTLTFSKTTQFNYADYKNGKQYSYSDFVKGTLKEASGGCVTPDTLVTLANGTQKRIDQVTYADQLLVWNFYTGKYDVAPASILMNHGASTVNVTTLNFSDGTSINTINGHGFFDVATNEFVLIDEFNAADYIGHSFVRQDGNGYSTVELVSCNVEEQYTEVWSVLTSVHYNCILEGMWTITAAEVDNSPEWLMPYEIGEDMKYDEAKMQAEIEKYGLYTYEDFAEYMTEEQFIALGLANFKVSVAKGYITWEEIEYLISIHIN